MEDEVISFIKHFQTPETIKIFTTGCCYWFAIILNKRFKEYNAKIMYHPINNHFAVLIKGKLYDITGEINSQQFWKWQKFANTDENLRKTIIRDCINKEIVTYEDTRK